MKKKDEALVVLSTKVPKSLKDRVEEFAESVGMSQSKVIAEALSKFLDGDDHSIDSVSTMQSEIAQLKKQFVRMQVLMNS